MYGQDGSGVLLDDTVEDDIIPPQEDVMLACDRRKSLSRQLSLDVGRVKISKQRIVKTKGHN
jgi:hypothetical protein